MLCGILYRTIDKIVTCIRNKDLGSKIVLYYYSVHYCILAAENLLIVPMVKIQ